MAPERRGDIASMGLLALVSGSFATFMTACFAGLLS
jgi:nucleoside permease NupC